MYSMFIFRFSWHDIYFSNKIFSSVFNNLIILTNQFTPSSLSSKKYICVLPRNFFRTMTKGLKRASGRTAQDTSEVFHEIEQKIKFYIHRETDIHRVDKVKIEKNIES